MHGMWKIFIFIYFDSPRLLDGFTNVYLSRTETSKPIMFAKTVMSMMYGSPKAVE